MKKYKAILTQRGFKEASTYEDMAGAIFVMFCFGFVLLCVSIIQLFLFCLTLTFCACIRGGITSLAIYMDVHCLDVS